MCDAEGAGVEFVFGTRRWWYGSYLFIFEDRYRTIGWMIGYW